MLRYFFLLLVILNIVSASNIELATMCLLEQNNECSLSNLIPGQIVDALLLILENSLPYLAVIGYLIYFYNRNKLHTLKVAFVSFFIACTFFSIKIITLTIRLIESNNEVSSTFVLEYPANILYTLGISAVALFIMHFAFENNLKNKSE